MSKIFITGDTHHDIDIAKLKKRNFEAITGIEFENITKDDYLIVCGDFGIVWFLDSQRRKEEFMLKWYEDKPWTTLFVDGNHENFDRLEQYPIETWHGGKIHRVSDSIIHLMRGQIFDIDRKAFFTMGGATSIDKPWRTPHVSWWPQELPTFAEYETAINNLQKHNMSVDYVLTHCCANTYQRDIINTSDVTEDDLNEFFRQIEFDNKLRFKHWYFGHYHADRQIDEKHTCLYQNIIRIQ